MLSGGPSSGSRQAIGVVLVFGVVYSTALTLFIVPVIYRWLAPYTKSTEARSRQLEAEAGHVPDAEAAMR